MAVNEWQSGRVEGRTAGPTEILCPTVEHRKRYVIRRVRATTSSPYASCKITGLHRRGFASEGARMRAARGPNAVTQKNPARLEAGRGSSRAVSQGVWKAVRG